MICFLFQLFTLSLLHVTCGVPIHGENGQIDDSPQARLIFKLADKDSNMMLLYDEFEQVFHDFDTDQNGNVTSTEFVDLWILDNLGEVQQGVKLFLNLDVNQDFVIDHTDMPYIFRFFDRNVDTQISEGEFVIQWVKISL
ncbi:uncharacterized protein LOC123561848 [Mercenaria mercenaria]|uniref:uncharacterized protein LOC123561848 n=1 Tax=Mercenaria mercenaria TaxID=6596 RepID=UPI00234EAEC4|nr:uncharacterized protein LOC123561848 [Mercenaria mercenaria]